MFLSIKKFFVEALIAIGIIASPTTVPPQDVLVPEPQATVQEYSAPEREIAPVVSVPKFTAPIQQAIEVLKSETHITPVITSSTVKEVEKPVLPKKEEVVSKKAHGSCGNIANTIVPANFDQKKLCSVGSSFGLTYTGNQITWSCTGIYGGDNKTCSATSAISQAAQPSVAKINGVCGYAHLQTYSTAPTAGLCSSGSPTTPTLNTTTKSYGWSCSDTGTTAECNASAYITPVNTIPPQCIGKTGMALTLCQLPHISN